MNPFGVHFSSMSVSKLVLVTPDGYVHPELGAQLPINVSAGAFPSDSRWLAFTYTPQSITRDQK